MDNASKALLIAGAVLLVIAIIAVAMGIFGTARGLVDKAEGQIDNMSIQMHNKQFEGYEGSNLTLKQVKECLSIIIVNNKENINNGEFIVKVYPKWYLSDGSESGYLPACLNGTIDVDEIGNSIVFTDKIINTWNYGKLYDIKFLYSNNGIINGIVFIRHYN